MCISPLSYAHLIILLAAALYSAPAAARKFYVDDPLTKEPPPRDASRAAGRKISDYYDFFRHNFRETGERHTPGRVIPSQGVDTLGEPPNGAWYTRRHYYQPMTVEELVRGPGNDKPPSMDGRWKVVKAKTEGITPGFEVIDGKGRRYVVKFDPKDYPEIASAPDVLVSKFFHALGYHVPENYIAYFKIEDLEIAENVKIVTATGEAKPMTRKDLVDLLMAVPYRDKRFRGAASLFLAGKPMGPFRYHGVRSDDPNDVIPHEHRRELRGLSIFCAWLGHDDSRAINTQDMLVEEGGVRYLRHHLIDFGSTLGSASNGINSPRSGFEYIVDFGAGFRQLATLGFWPPSWALAKFPKHPSVGRFESKKFDAARWVPEYPNPAFINRLADDEFWAAKQVMAFSDEQIAAIVKTGQYSDPRAEKWIVDCLIERRDKIGRAFLEKVLPIDRFAVENGRLVFEDLGVKHGTVPSRQYNWQWSDFDNDAGRKTPIDGAISHEIPAGPAAGAFLAADVHGGDTKKMVTVYLRRRADTWEVVGVDRRW